MTQYCHGEFLQNTIVQSPCYPDPQLQQSWLVLPIALTYANPQVVKWTTAAVEDPMTALIAFQDVEIIQG